MEVNPERLVKFLKTDEDWYPTLADGTVRAFHCELPRLKSTAPRMWRTAVWGNDDFGLEFDSIDQALALEMYDLLCDGVTQKELLDLGFVHA